MRRASILGLVVLAIGCNAITGIDDYSSSADAADAHGGLDPSNVLDNPDFEKAACEGWTGDEANLTQIDGVAHTGNRSCQVCSISTTAVFGVGQDRDAQKGLVPGTQYVAEAWVRAADDQPPTQNISIVLTLEDGDGGLIDRDERGGPMDLDTTWQHVVTTLTFQANDVSSFEVLARSPTGCFLVDDVSMHPAD